MHCYNLHPKCPSHVFQHLTPSWGAVMESYRTYTKLVSKKLNPFYNEYDHMVLRPLELIFSMNVKEHGAIGQS